LSNYETEEDFLKDYKPKEYPSNAYTADIVILTIKDGKLCVLLVKRGGWPYKDCYALPGGFVDQDETSEMAAARELKEETNVEFEAHNLEQLKTYSTPGRDPRMRVISTAYLVFAPTGLIGTPVAGDDAVEAHFFAIEDIAGFNSNNDGIRLAFDHSTILADALERAASKLEDLPVATAFLDGTFTIPELRRVYEAVWGFPLHASNFRRKVLNTEGFVEPVGEVGKNDASGRVAELYKAGDVRILHPAILRSKSR